MLFLYVFSHDYITNVKFMTCEASCDFNLCAFFHLISPLFCSDVPYHTSFTPIVNRFFSKIFSIETLDSEISRCIIAHLPFGIGVPMVPLASSLKQTCQFVVVEEL